MTAERDAASLKSDHALHDANRRTANIATIRANYGTDSMLGRRLLNEVVARHILDLLPDAAVAELAQLHREAADDRRMKCSLSPGPDDGGDQ